MGFVSIKIYNKILWLKVASCCKIMVMLTYKKSIHLVLALGLISTILLPIFPAKKAAAQTAPPSQSDVESGNYRFIDRGRIIGTIGGQDYTFVDTDPLDDLNRYEILSSDSPCDGRITFTSVGSSIRTTGTDGQGQGTVALASVDIDVGPACQGTSPNVLQDVRVNAQYAEAFFYWQNDMTIMLVGDATNSRNQFVRTDPNSPVFTQQGESQCADKLILVDQNAVRLYRLDNDGSNWDDVSASDLELVQPGQCKLHGRSVGGNISPQSLWLVGRTQNAVLSTAENPVPGGTGAAEDARDSCESIGALGWIICPVILAVDSGLSWVDTQIQSLLAMDENKYNNRGLETAWRSIRNIAYIVLIPIMLVMVIGTALGFEIFSAYTVKKALPRMIIAVIFITLSWYITSFLINFFNVLGGGILGLLTSPFDFNGNAVSTLSIADLFQPSGGSFWQTILAQGTLTLGIAVIIALYLGPLTLIVLTAFFILFLRQMFIIALALLAPLAILSWIFPGNDKLWKLWWGAFSKLLIMFPLIMAVIAVGRIFAAIIAGPVDDGGVDDWFLTPFFILAAYILPYAIIPFTFKMAGGMFATITGMVNDREKGLFDRMSKRREAKTERLGRKPKAYVAGKRYDTARGMQDWASNRSGGRVGRMAAFMGRRAASVTGGADYELHNSQRNAEAAKIIDAEKSTGNDAQVRGATTQLKRVKQLLAKGNARTDEENAELGRLYNSQTGKYITLGGSEVSEADAIAGHRRFGTDRAMQQAILNYEMGKAKSSEQVEGLISRYQSMATQEWDMNEREAGAAWVGAAFGAQNQHVELKSVDAATGTLNHEKFVNEVFENKGSYPLAQMNAHTIESLSTAYDTDYGSVEKNQEVQQKIKEIVETFRVSGGMIPAGEDGAPIPAGGASGGQVISAPGSAAVNQALQELHSKTHGPVHGPPLPPVHGPPSPGSTP